LFPIIILGGSFYFVNDKNEYYIQNNQKRSYYLTNQTSSAIYIPDKYAIDNGFKAGYVHIFIFIQGR